MNYLQDDYDFDSEGDWDYDDCSQDHLDLSKEDRNKLLLTALIDHQLVLVAKVNLAISHCMLTHYGLSDDDDAVIAQHKYKVGYKHWNEGIGILCDFAEEHNLDLDVDNGSLYPASSPFG